MNNDVSVFLVFLFIKKTKDKSIHILLHLKAPLGWPKKSFFFNGSANKALIPPPLDLNGRQNFDRKKKVLIGTALPLK